MPYNCTMTDENKFIYETRIYELIALFNETRNTVLLEFIIVAIIEYLFAIAYINTKDLIDTKAAFIRLHLGLSGGSLVKVMKQVRDFTVHAPNNFSLGVMIALRQKSTVNAVKDLLPYFSNREPIIQLFKWISQNYAKFDNIDAYCNKLSLSRKQSDADSVRLMRLLNAKTYTELNEKITTIL